MEKGAVERSVKSDGPAVRSFTQEASGETVYLGAADALGCWVDMRTEDPQVVVATYKDRAGYFLAYTKPSDLEGLADLLRDAAQHLRAKPKPEPEVQP